MGGDDLLVRIPVATPRLGADILFGGSGNDRLIGVSLLTEEDDVLLATRNGKAIRFLSTDVREFQSRTATGVRGIRLLGIDSVYQPMTPRRTAWQRRRR